MHRRHHATALISTKRISRLASTVHLRQKTFKVARGDMRMKLVTRPPTQTAQRHPLAQMRQLGTGAALRLPRDCAQVAAGGQRQLARVNPQDVEALVAVRLLEGNVVVESAVLTQLGMQALQLDHRGDHDDSCRMPAETVHFVLQLHAKTAVAVLYVSSQSCDVHATQTVNSDHGRLRTQAPH